MKYKLIKVLLFTFFLLTIIFFSNDFGLIDIERTAIYTAVALDINDEGKYEVTAQIAVPEATDTNTENKRALITGTGITVGSAIKNLSNISGWYPSLYFCNVIIISKELTKSNLINILDYFSKTLRIQDSALVMLAESSAKEILESTTPLEGISSFALQKVLIKNHGFENSIATMNIKDFVTGYYSDAGSSFMPIIKKIEQTTGSNIDSSKSSSGGSSGGGNSAEQQSESKDEKKETLFSADTTALFVKGKLVGELDNELSFVFNNLREEMKGATFDIEKDEILAPSNYFLTVVDNRSDIKIETTENNITLNIYLNIFCKITDTNGENEDQDYSYNTPLPSGVKQKSEQIIYQNTEKLIQTIKSSKCDILNLKQKLYQKHFKYYSRYKDNYLEKIDYNINVIVNSQK